MCLFVCFLTVAMTHWENLRSNYCFIAKPENFSQLDLGKGVGTDYRSSDVPPTESESQQSLSYLVNGPVLDHCRPFADIGLPLQWTNKDRMLTQCWGPGCQHRLCSPRLQQQNHSRTQVWYVGCSRFWADSYPRDQQEIIKNLVCRVSGLSLHPTNSTFNGNACCIWSWLWLLVQTVPAGMTDWAMVLWS